MCVAAVAWNAHPRWKLVIAANRDEFHERPTAPLSRWEGGTLAGKDLRAGGTWLGVNEAGHFALVTNHRSEGYPKLGLLTRGGLVTAWLDRSGLGDTAAMNPFNLLCGGPDGLRFVSNWPEENRLLQLGIHGVSNGPFAEPWPKARKLCAALKDWLDAGHASYSDLFAALRNDTTDAGISQSAADPEPRQSGVFIRDPVYGTRCSTVVLVGHDGRGAIIEVSYSPDGAETGMQTLPFRWPGGQSTT